ncbi:hypothetical protein U1839_01960 [Sphingomonas sp. RT2P30]|uniref:hypothetical protein n=1 Tax=Parasphingomonas halimpatiens TaxID=3096162 RepID=UPI002FCB7CDE
MHPIARLRGRLADFAARNSIEIGIDVPADELLVLVVRDAALRVMLVGQLSLGGESIVSFDGPIADAAFERIARPPAILITDDEALGASFAAIAEGERWRGLIHLADDRDDPVRGDKVARVDRREAFAQVSATIASWRRARHTRRALADLTTSE